MTEARDFRIGVLAGDGIGPEVTAAAVEAVQAAAHRAGMGLQLSTGLVGWKPYETVGSLLPDDTIDMLKQQDGWIMGPTFAGEYPKAAPINGHPSGYLRRIFNLFANVRPVAAYNALDPIIPGLDITVLRENTQGFYPDRNMVWGYGEFRPTDDVALSVRVITATASERFARFCLDFAATRGIERLHVVHKRTALPQTEGVFIAAFENLMPQYPTVALELLRVDTFSSSFPRNHKKYQLVATTNLFGDILSDQASGLAGGVGLAPSLNAGLDHAMAQAVHGTAPDIAGKGIANPSALILSSALLLHWLYQRTQVPACRTAARFLERGVEAALQAGVLTADLGGSARTDDVTRAVVGAIADMAAEA